MGCAREAHRNWVPRYEASSLSSRVVLRPSERYLERDARGVRFEISCLLMNVLIDHW